MKKEYTEIQGILVAHKGVVGLIERREIFVDITEGLISGKLGKKGWWIIAKPK